MSGWWWSCRPVKYSAHRGKKIMVQMTIIVKGEFPEYSQYLLLLDFCFRFSSVIKLYKLSPYFFFIRELWSGDPPQTALWSFPPPVSMNKVSFVILVSFYHIYSTLTYCSVKGKSSKNEGTNVSSQNLSMESVIYCHQWLHLWHEALFMILLYKWPCFEVQKKWRKDYKMYNNGPAKDLKLCCISMK